MQKTKVRAIVSSLGTAGNVTTYVAIAAAVDNTRANYYDTYVKPFATIDSMEWDISMYQDGTSVSVDGFIDWAIYKVVGGNPATIDPAGSGLASAPFIFKTGRAAVPQLTAIGTPSIFHLSGRMTLPPRFRIFAPGDSMYFVFKGSPAGAGVSYSVNGIIHYMFKV